MKVLKALFLTLLLVITGCKTAEIKTKPISENTLKQVVNTNLDAWHKAAADADFEAYFNLMTSDGVFIGTDATENWQLKAFKTFSKPYFDRGKAWSFEAIERHIYISENQDIVWFDELLDTQMKICRGSGVMKQENGEWKVAHYVLSIAIPNDKVNQVIELKKDQDSLHAHKLKMKKQ